jgi:2-oxoglutarate dehydrogenase complex dehydrogenase (E1) component-like enzyme
MHPRLRRLFADVRRDRIEKGEGVDWATAEAMAFGSLLVDGFNVRLSGQVGGGGANFFMFSLFNGLH